MYTNYPAYLSSDGADKNTTKEPRMTAQFASVHSFNLLDGKSHATATRISRVLYYHGKNQQ